MNMLIDVLQLIFTPSMDRRQEARFYRTALITFLAPFIYFFRFAIVWFQSPDNQVGMAIAFAIGGMLLVTAGVFFARHRKYSTAYLFLIVSIVFTFVSFPLVFERISLILPLAVFLVVLDLSISVLPPRLTPWAISIALLNILLASYVTLNPPFEKLFVYGMPVVVSILSTIAITLVILHLIWSFRNLQLTGKLVVLFTLVALLVTIVFAYLNLTQTENMLRQNIGAQVSSEAVTRAIAIGDQLQNEVDGLQTLGISETLQRWIDAANRSFGPVSAQARTVLAQKDESWRRLSDAGDSNAPEVQDVLLNEAALDLREYATIFPDNGELLLTDKYGGLIAANEMTSDYYQGDEGWWQAAYNGGEGGLYISQPAYDESLGADAVIIAIPVLSRDRQEVIGVLRTTVVASGLFSPLDIGGTKVHTTDLIFPGAENLRVHDGEIERLPEDILSQLSNLALASFTEMEYDGQPSLVARSLVTSSGDDPDIAQLGWYTLNHQTAEAALAPVSAQRDSSLALAGIILAGASLLAVFVAQLFAGPIVRLTEATDQVRLGNLDVQAQVRSQDEVGRLAITFNDMTARLKSTLFGLEQRIADRTRELTLAGELGRSLSQERDLDRLLSAAVEQVRATFDLYYTQIYLTDPTGKSLILRAGSGSVGEELLSRGHRLALAPGSINGESASRRQPVIVEDTAASVTYKPNALLPDTRSEMAVPLLVGDRVVGVLDMQSRRPHGLSSDSLPAFQALAGQLAVAVDNALLFASVQEARREVERQAGRVARLGWEEYLNATDRPERLGFVLGPDGLIPIAQAESINSFSVPRQAVQAAVKVTGEPVGKIELERGQSQGWQPEEIDLVNTVAAQVGRQIEELRLLAEAQRYRQEAETVARQLTRTGWETYLAEQLDGQPPAFVYAGDRVVSENVTGALPAPALRHSLVVHGEAVGEFSVEGDQPLDDSQVEMIQVVAGRLSEHIESLRLVSQTRQALAATETLYLGSSRVVHSASYSDVLVSLVESTSLQRFDHAHILLFDQSWEAEMPVYGTVVAAWERIGGEPSNPVGQEAPLLAIPFTPLANRDQPVLIQDTDEDERLDWTTRHLFRQMGKSVAVFPLVTGKQWIGWLSLSSAAQVVLNSEQVRQIQALASQASAVLQGLRLLEFTQANARREQILRQVAERVRGAADPEMVVRAAAREVGAVLHRNVLIRIAPQTSSGADEEKHASPDTNGSTQGNGRSR